MLPQAPHLRGKTQDYTKHEPVKMFQNKQIKVSTCYCLGTRREGYEHNTVSVGNCFESVTVQIFGNDNNISKSHSQ